MRKLKLFLLFTAISLVSFAQDCKMYFPQEEGSIVEFTSYNKKGKKESVSQTEITEKKVSGGDVYIKAKMTANIEAKEKDQVEMDYEAQCVNGVFSVNSFAALSGMEQSGSFEIEGDFLDIPTNAKAGQELEDKTIKIKMEGMEDMPAMAANMLNFTYNFVNRKVEAIEEITTPAGTFTAVKISYDMEMKMMMTMSFHMVEWYAEGVGAVRTEMYRKGKLDSYTELTKISN